MTDGVQRVLPATPKHDDDLQWAREEGEIMRGQGRAGTMRTVTFKTARCEKLS
jgi:hypothetical protein